MHIILALKFNNVKPITNSFIFPHKLREYPQFVVFDSSCNLHLITFPTQALKVLS